MKHATTTAVSFALACAASAQAPIERLFRIPSPVGLTQATLGIPAITADFNGDGFDDVVMRDGFVLLTNAGTMAPSPSPRFADPSDFAHADFDGDSDTDLVVTRFDDPSPGLYLCKRPADPILNSAPACAA
jgi:hypothetical protein